MVSFPFEGDEHIFMKTWTEKSRQDWNERATDWHRKSEHMWTWGSRKDVIPAITSHLKTGLSILDVGCGDGTGSYLAAEKGYHVTGIDLSSEMIELARKRKHEKLSFKNGTLKELGFADESFDAVMCINALEWTEDPYGEMVEIDRVLKPGSKMFCAILGPTSGPRTNSFDRLTGGQTICNTMMPWEFAGLAKKLNWKQLDERYVYKDQVDPKAARNMPPVLKQSLTFFTLFVYSKKT